MNFTPYTIIYRQNLADDIFVLRLKPAHGDKIPDRKPGQFAIFKNPAYQLPEQTHIFSFASSPLQKNYVEFCIRVYGNWTKFLWDNTQNGYQLLLSDPIGFFTWNESVKHAVFLVGGIGISPVMGMLRTIAEIHGEYDMTLLYGSRTPETIAYKKELEELAKRINKLKIVHILSEISEQDSWKGYRGFITPDIILQEVNLSLNPNFFLTGNPPFLKLIESILIEEFKIPNDQIKKEIISGMKLA